MKRFLMYATLAVLLAGLVSPMPSLAQAAIPAHQTYTILVGYENAHTGLGVMSFFPGTVTIHAGDTVHWLANSNEIHTVSFGYGPVGSDLPPLLVPAASLGYPELPGWPPSPPFPPSLVLSPIVATHVPESGMDFVANANSGLMSKLPDAVQTFDLTFPAVGDYLYVCLIHGWMMQGTVHVVSPDVNIDSPNQSMAMGQQEIAAALAQVPAAMQDARQQIQPPTMKGDGAMTHKVMVGYHEGPIELMQFFPDQLVVRPGDTVVWELSAANDAPHTITFLNGAQGPEDFKPVVLSDGTLVLYANPQALFPSPFPPTADLTRQGFYNSGVLNPPLPGDPAPTYSLKIGDMSPGLQPYECLLHDESGMSGTLMVVPRKP